ncbi:MAG TPA: hypothetical protein PKZ24_06010, partial [Nitrospirales bacterium]|nr:hypothetical protein [Nitrospirales bacterium]
MESESNKNRDGELAKTLHHLRERVKELSALHATAQLFQHEDLSIEELLQAVANFIPPSWQYPDITASRIRFGSFSINTANYVPSVWSQRG